MTRDLIALAKPRVTALVLLTAGVGLAMAPTSVSIDVVASMLVLTMLLVAGANVLNCWWERDTDALMERTRSRPLPDGRLNPQIALIFGLVLAAVSLPALFILVNPITAILGGVALASYVLAYTPLKAVHPSALTVGAVPGAMPALMGWTAATNEIGWGGVALFAIVFVWQMPHVIGLSCKNAAEYAAAGMKVLPILRGESVAKWHAVMWGVVMIPTSLTPYWYGLGGTVYAVGAVGLSVAYLVAALIGFRTDSAIVWGRRLFLSSLAYLPLVFGLLIVDAV